MSMTSILSTTGRRIAVAGALAATVALAAPQPAAAYWHHWGHRYWGPGPAIGLGLGAFALGATVGAVTSPYYAYPYGYYYAAPGYYYAPHYYYYRPY
jgi:hypothetical protein